MKGSLAKKLMLVLVVLTSLLLQWKLPTISYEQTFSYLEQYLETAANLSRTNDHYLAPEMSKLPVLFRKISYSLSTSSNLSWIFCPHHLFSSPCSIFLFLPAGVSLSQIFFLILGLLKVVLPKKCVCLVGKLPFSTVLLNLIADVDISTVRKSRSNNRSSQHTSNIREAFKNYFNNEGSIQFNVS